MRRLLTVVAVVALALAVVTPATGDDGTGELMASFHAGLGGGAAIDAHGTVADSVASPQIFPDGRIEPFGTPEFICPDTIVGTWAYVVDPSRDLLNAWTNEFWLDGVPLEVTRTPLKRGTGGFQGGWWFAEGVPVLGTLSPGLHVVTLTIDDGFGFSLTFITNVDVDAAYC